jgi:tryptophan synthase alpha subunit
MFGIRKLDAHSNKFYKLTYFAGVAGVLVPDLTGCPLPSHANRFPDTPNTNNIAITAFFIATP